MQDDTTAALRRAMSTGLHASSPFAEPFILDDERTWSATFSWFAHQHLLGVLQAAVAAGDFSVSDARRLELDRGCATAAEGFRRIQDGALAASRALKVAGIPHRFFKGVAVACLAEFAGLRHATDADVVVPAARFDDALTTLRSAGYHPFKDVPEGGVPGSVMSVNLARELSLVDLHRGLSVMPFAARIGDRPFAEPGETGTVSGGQLPILSAPALGVVAALEVAFHDRPVKPAAARDSLLLARRDSDGIHQVAQSWGVEGPTALGLMLAGTYLEVEEQIPDWVLDVDIQPRDLALYRAFEAHARVPYLVHTLLDLPSWSTRRVFLVSWIPARRQLAERGGVGALFRRQVASTKEVLARRRAEHAARKELEP